MSLAVWLSVWFLTACVSNSKTPDLGGLYNSLVQNESPYRNPVILISGLLGSKLIVEQTGTVAWGTFGVGNISPGTAQVLTDIALPMCRGNGWEICIVFLMESQRN